MSYTTEKILEAFRNENPSQFINALTGEDIKEFLIEVNRQVRELNPEEGGIYKGDRMIVGECISPKGAIQEKYFDKSHSELYRDLFKLGMKALEQQQSPANR